ncbi:MAG TPA: hypothetical protein VLJ16_05615 [Acidobacteriota bacterium]|nr:hypothetical protein [Acidobacteriota bacterium]
MAAKRIVLAGLLLCAAALAAAQEPPVQPIPPPAKPLFVRWTVYPTASLSRYDYNNDVDQFEVRIYVELRLGSQEGPAVPDAVVMSLGEKLDFVTDHFEKRIVYEKGARPSEIDLEVAVKDRPPLKDRQPLPDWLVLTEPRPSIIETGSDIGVHWKFEHFEAPADVIAYDFRTGQELLRRINEPGTSVVIPAAAVHSDTIIRLYVIQSWLYKRYLDGPAYARGSEVVVIPWSQVFFRTRGPARGGRP